MNDRSFDYCIVGAGPSGLTAAYQLLKAGRSVVLVERADRAGGLAKSRNFDGHTFDTGPHYFHTEDPIVVDFINDITSEYYTKIQLSKIYFAGQYYRWPPQLQDFLRMPFKTSMACLLDLLSRNPPTDTASFHHITSSQYGETVYNTFLKDYAEKFLCWDPEDLHADWSLPGALNGVKSKTLSEYFKNMLFCKNDHSKYLYPVRGGFGQFYEQLLMLCQNFQDFNLILSDEFQQITDQGKSFRGQTKKGQVLEFYDLIWTGNLNMLSSLINNKKTHVHYLNTVFFNVVCKEQGVPSRRTQWVCVCPKDHLISRITCMREFALSTCKVGYYNIICELTDSQLKPVYALEPQHYADRVLEELLKMRFITDRKYVESVHPVIVKDTYPVYHRAYLKDFGCCASGIKSFSNRIHLIGRSGAFWYSNSNHSIRFAIEKTNQLLGNKTEEFNYRKYFGRDARTYSPQGV